MGSGNRRLTLLEQMSAVDNGRNNLAGLTLDDILGKATRPEQTPVQKRTLLEIIREDGSNKDKKSWQTFRDKLRLKRAGSAWTSSVPIPASDVNVHSNRSQFSRHGSFRSTLADSTRVEGAAESVPISDPPVVNSRMQLAWRVSVRFGNNSAQTDYDDSVNASMPSDCPSRSFRPQSTRHHSTRLPTSNTDGGAVVDGRDDNDDSSTLARDRSRQLGVALEEERALSAREAVAAQEAAATEQIAAAQNNAPATGAAEDPVRMSLMDLLGETGYTMGDDEYDEEEEEEEQEEKEDLAVEASGAIEHTCCICMVRHKGSAFIPCGHTFCRLCSRELMVQRGNCPICNGFILEILDIF